MTATLDPRADTPADGYVLGRTSSEYERLRTQARQLSPHTAALLNRLGLAPGMRCLDVGCGPGEVMRLMAERIGESGSVLGVDLDGRLGREGLAMLHELGHTQCRFAEGDITTMALPEPAAFDLTYARLVLIHSPDPLAVLRRMWDCTAPGGHLLVQDYDLHVVASDPALPVFEECRRVVLGVFERSGRPLDMGLRLRRYVAEACGGPADGTKVDGILEPLREVRTLLGGVYRSVLPRALQLGLISDADADAWFAELEATPDETTVLMPLHIGAWKRRPN